jgi:hypothetical protein
MKRIMGAVGIAFSIAVICAIVYVAWMIRHGFSTRTPPGLVETELAETISDMSIPSRYKTMKNPVTATPEVLEESMAHWADHCASCHANNGSGDTMYGKTMYPRPPDMRQKDTRQMSDGELYYTIKNGVDDQDSWKLVAFIRQLPSLSQSESLEMDKLNPKSPQEIKEEQQEDNFLQGGPVPSQPVSAHHHGKETP